MQRETPRRSDPRTGRARTLRHDATPAERALWQQLRLLEWPAGHFRRQAPIGPYYADFAHHGLRLIVELDGGQHGLPTRQRRDAKRTAYLEAAGYRVLRFWNAEVVENLDGVVETIIAAAAARPPTPVRTCGPTRPSPPQAGGGWCGGSLALDLHALIAAGEPTILVTITHAHGSTPREAGAAMIVTLGDTSGTIGGGHLEFHAVDTARVMLARGEERRELDLALGPLLGQCCGGRVRLRLDRAAPAHAAELAAREAAERSERPAVLIFGSGHTGTALARALAPLPIRTTLVDDRLDIPAEPVPGIDLVLLDDPAAAVARAEPGAAFVILTHSHALDYRLAEAVLRRGDAAYCGLIGSATKRARFEAAALRAGLDPAPLVCPIGGSAVPDKRPSVIAALVAAELLVVFARRAAEAPLETLPA